MHNIVEYRIVGRGGGEGFIEEKNSSLQAYLVFSLGNKIHHVLHCNSVYYGNYTLPTVITGYWDESFSLTNT